MMGASNTKQKPNILIIMADQLRADLLEREGYLLNTMPVVDSLAQRGIWFNRAYTTAPASGPARVS
ncbi:MAG: sulfatase-like hydrolase/transferase, partial [Bacteroides sp.]|nr:sulfatase-like hydrolase/transferase [Bacteroides sp.]